ncbi:MAG: CopL family metal-binding regulatory protein [Rhodanobacteraceae bacterium]|nr:CopL family metal-binding regulatory protein [Rhodanobacteraceae bacterium]
MHWFPCLGFLVLRFAVRPLLALLVCLNGLPQAVAMTAPADAAAMAPEAAPCHGDSSAADTATPDHPEHDGLSTCCKPGHCTCACAFSLSLPLGNASGPAASQSEQVPLPRAMGLPSIRISVPLRPPIA